MVRANRAVAEVGERLGKRALEGSIYSGVRTGGGGGGSPQLGEL